MKHVHDGLGRLVEVLKDGVSQVRYGYTADGRLAWRRVSVSTLNGPRLTGFLTSFPP